MSTTNVEEIVSGTTDIYAFLEVSPDATETEIKRQYRRKALEYHPDKNPSEEAAIKFNLLSQIYEILTSDLRKEYDRIRNIRLHKAQEASKLTEETRRFKEELERAEREHRFNTTGVFDASSKDYIQRNLFEKNLERLKEDGLKRRRKQEQELLNSENEKSNMESTKDDAKYVSFRDINIDGVKQISLMNSQIQQKQTKCIVKWKHKPELKGLITEEVLAEIMSIFGPIVESKIYPTKKNARYDTALISFQTLEGASNATNHNYKQSATLWDGTSVRKLSSLLRDCQYLKELMEEVVTPEGHLDTDKVYKLLKNTDNIYPKTLINNVLHSESNCYLEKTLKNVVYNDIRGGQ